MTTLTSREFNRNSSAAKRAAGDGPVFVTDRGEPTLVVMTYGHYRSLVGDRATLPELLSRTASVGDVEFDASRRGDQPRPAAFD